MRVYSFKANILRILRYVVDLINVKNPKPNVGGYAYITYENVYKI